MIAQIKMRRGTTAEWAAANPVVLAAGEMGLDTTIQKSKIGDGTTEWASLPWLNGDVTNPNILHNADFTNPINQRGVVTGYRPGYSYAYDRWLMNNRVWVGVGTSVNLAAYNGTAAYIEQRIEHDLRGRTYTLSADIAYMGLVSVVLNYPANGAETQGELSGLILSLERIGSYDTVRITNLNSDSERPIKRVKLELGAVSTLHLDPPMDHAVELPKCQRFYWRGAIQNSLGYRYMTAFTLAEAGSMSLNMRTIPTTNIVVNPDYHNSSNATLSADASGIVLRCTVTAAGYYRAPGGVYEASADL